MSYTVSRLDKGRWQLTSPWGSNLGVLSSRSAAVTRGRALAGWRFSVVVL